MATYNENMSGGGLTSGGALDFETRLRDDGCYCGTQTHSETGSGGLICSGAAEVTDNVVRGSGGIILNGSATIDVAQDPWDGIEAVWPLFEESTGLPDEFQDRSRNQLHGTGAGKLPQQEDGVFCLPSQGFYGEEWIVVPPDSIGPRQPFTVTLWVNMHGFWEQRAFFSRGHTGSTSGWVFMLGRSVLAHAWASFNTTDGTVESAENAYSDQLELDRWYHLAVTWDGSEAKVFVNSTLQATWDMTGDTLVGLSNTGRIGGWNDGGSPNANIQCVKLYPEAKSAAWIKAEYDQWCDRGFYYVESRFSPTCG